MRQIEDVNLTHVRSPHHFIVQFARLGSFAWFASGPRMNRVPWARSSPQGERPEVHSDLNPDSILHAISCPQLVSESCLGSGAVTSR